MTINSLIIDGFIKFANQSEEQLISGYLETIYSTNAGQALFESLRATGRIVNYTLTNEASQNTGF